jgi:hypothetical protein
VTVVALGGWHNTTTRSLQDEGVLRRDQAPDTDRRVEREASYRSSGQRGTGSNTQK